ncbi:Branched-chain amino acid transport system / permease component [Gaiella occulta]|uniref:Branched-chain amino acid transport system / permease component n=1 Tax=Gaiella occulta TaxID=1002870 RepID=A0A7M2YWA3_9ACTN|nr:branched-chain amino acid ABC transporter permease [Gaiella occulta]RDI74422.1 Branched-chain amino acid transport system / permease component [Gaiella occulta]
MSEQRPPESAGTTPAVGKDEWVARLDDNRARRTGLPGVVEERLRNVPWWAWLTLFVAAVAALPIVYDSGYVRRVAFDTVVYMLLALGLNVVVGWGGLLDLGYVAFYGIGAYSYALLSSNQFDVHLPTLVTVPLVVAIGAVVGLLVGLPSRRLSGDYLAIVTLFFFQLFIVVVTNGDHLFGTNVTGGSNGIGGVEADVDPFNLFGRDLVVSTGGIFNVWYLYVALAFFVVVFVLLRFVNHSRIGRAWRSLREDPLAAEMMGMPVNWLKLLAFSFGAAVAALSGTIFAGLNGGVFPTTFAFPLLITVYTMVILGGSGSQAGVVVGAILVNVLLELLRDPGQSRYLFYFLIVVGLLAIFRLSVRLAVVLGGTIVLGFAVHAIASSISDAAVSGASNGGGWLADALRQWVITPSSLGAWAPISYVALVSLVLVLTLLAGWVRIAVLVPTLYLAAFVWENVMLAKPEATRFIVLGAILVAVMIVRPSGLLGEKRVEIV